MNFLLLGVLMVYGEVLFSAIILPDSENDLRPLIKSLQHQSLSSTQYEIIQLIPDENPEPKRRSHNHHIIALTKARSKSALSIAIAASHGTYVCFLDGSYSWDRHYLKNIKHFLDEANSNFPIITGTPESKAKLSAQSYIVNCTTQESFPPCSCCFVLKSVMAMQHNYSSITYGQHHFYLHHTALHNPFIPIVKDAICYPSKHYHRYVTVDYYSAPSTLYSELINESIKLYNYTLQFIQTFIVNDLEMSLLHPIPRSLKQFIQEDEYIDSVINILQFIEDRTILQACNLDPQTKLFTLSKKHQTDLRKEIYLQGSQFFFRNQTVLSILHKPLIRWLNLSVSGDHLVLEGQDLSWLRESSYSYVIKYNSCDYRPNSSYPYSQYNLETTLGTVLAGRILKFVLPLSKKAARMDLCFATHGRFFSIVTSSAPSFKLQPVSGAYYTSTKYIIQHQGSSFLVRSYNRMHHLLCELRYCKQLMLLKRWNIILYRLLYWLNKQNIKKIYLFSDRYAQADDNAEHLFRYISSHKHPDWKLFYCIKRSSPDFQRLRRIGSVLPLGSVKYKLYFLLSDFIISSATNLWVDHAFLHDQKYIVDLLHFHYVFLQHGVTKDDVSSYLHRYARPFSLFVTSSQREFNSILQGNYHYHSNEVRLVGMPRFDELLRLKQTVKKRKQILIIPTWRASIKGTQASFTAESLYSRDFKLSPFFGYYNTLINHPVLCRQMKDLGFTGLFLLHPTLSKHAGDFDSNSIIKVSSSRSNYQQLLVTSSLLVTDYSSVFFDFGYLHRPIVYSQFDLEDYRRSQYNTGYFNYLQDGFGPVCDDMESTVSHIISIIKHNCSLSAAYKARIDAFFEFIDTDNCQRVLECLQSLTTVVRPSFEPARKIAHVLVLFIVIIYLYDHASKKRTVHLD